MAELKYGRVRQLKEMGREIIDLPADINFAGREDLQRQMGTYWHVDLCRHRLRVAEDRLKRILESKASTYESKEYGDIEALEETIKARKNELLIVLSGGNPEKDTLSSLVKEEDVKDPIKKDEGKKSELTDLDTEKPMNVAAAAKMLKAMKTAKPKKGEDDEE